MPSALAGTQHLLSVQVTELVDPNFLVYEAGAAAHHAGLLWGQGPDRRPSVFTKCCQGQAPHTASHSLGKHLRSSPVSPALCMALQALGIRSEDAKTPSW